MIFTVGCLPTFFIVSSYFNEDWYSLKLAATIKPSSNLHADFFIIEVMRSFFSFHFITFFCVHLQQLARIIPMEPDVQRSVDIVWTKNSVIISKELVTTGVRLAITHHAVRKVYQQENKQTHTYIHFYLNSFTWLKVQYFFYPCIL